ncbi:MAG TPA: alpha-glucosidase [Bacilli bacterium]|nr:alpha-glucosidase [Bacilli bacterium]
MKNNWWNKRVFYQIYPRSFYDTNGDGVGDIQGIIKKLPYLKELGIGALWLSPLYASPNYDFGYDISDYYNIGKEYGTLKDFDALIKAANKFDIKIVMDLVINHTSFKHQWFEASKDPKSEYHNYYIWREGRGRKKNKAPNNWQSMFTGPAWTYEKSNNLFYLHLFTREQPDLNFYHRPVIDEVKKIMTFWLERGAHGFRCDVINCIYKDSLKNARQRVYKTGKEYYLNTKGTHDILKEIHRDVLLKFNAYTVGETTDITIHEAKAYLEDELTHIFPFEHTELDRFKLPIFKRKFRPSRLIKVLKKWHAALPPQTIFFENHDMPRIISRYGDEKRHQESGSAYAALILTMQATPYIYQGQEIGMLNSNFKDVSEMQDVSSINVYKLLRKLLFTHKRAIKMVNHFCRDHGRTPMQWNDKKHGGFSTHKPWLKVNDNYKEINVDKALKNKDSLYYDYQKLIALRKATPAILEGSLTFIATNKNVMAYDRILNEEVVRVVINLSNKEERIKINLDGELLYSNYAEFSDHQTKLRPYETQIIKR